MDGGRMTDAAHNHWEPLTPDTVSGGGEFYSM